MNTGLIILLILITWILMIGGVVLIKIWLATLNAKVTYVATKLRNIEATQFTPMSTGEINLYKEDAIEPKALYEEPKGTIDDPLPTPSVTCKTINMGNIKRHCELTPTKEEE